MGGMVTVNQIKEHIARHLQWDDSLKGSRINVDYLGRKAILTGTVPNLLAHAMAQRDAQSIPGVESVENRLIVQFQHDHPNKNDRELQSDVSKVLSCTAEIDMKKIQISVQDSIVQIKGSTEAYWKKARIEELASSIEDVLEVRNEVQVLPVDQAPDASIRQDIILALQRMEVPGLDRLQIKVNRGVVKISGTVPTWSISFDVEDTARYTAGVIDVINNLTVD